MVHGYILAWNCIRSSYSAWHHGSRGWCLVEISRACWRGIVRDLKIDLYAPAHPCIVCRFKVAQPQSPAGSLLEETREPLDQFPKRKIFNLQSSIYSFICQ